MNGLIMRNSGFFAGQKGKISVTTSEQAITTKPEQNNSDESN
jgi:hypothetical protein